MWYIIEKPKIELLLSDLATVVGLPVSFFDIKKTLVLSFNKQQEFCRIIQTVPENLEKCRKCDWSYILESERSKSPIVYTCHLGLTEVIIPIKIENTVMSWVMFGEFISGGTMEGKWNQTWQKLKKYNLDEKELKEKFMDLKYFPGQDGINPYLRLFTIGLQHCVCEKVIRPRYPTKLEEALELIDENLDKPITVNKLAERLDISPVYLTSLMNREIGIAPGKYIIRQKIERAAELLSSDSMKISEVSHRVGIHDEGYFSRLFKKNYGVSPSEYRKRNAALTNEYLEIKKNSDL